MRRLANLGVTPDLAPFFAKRIVLTNMLGWLFAANMTVSTLAFAWFGQYSLAVFTAFFALSEVCWPVLNHFRRYDLSRVGMLITSNLLGLSVSVMLPNTGYNRGFYVMAGLPILLFSLKERRFIVLGLLLPLCLYPFSEWAQYAFPQSLGLSLSLSPEAATLIRYSIGTIYVLLIFLMFLFLSTQSARAEERLEEQRAKAFSSAKFAALGEMVGGIGHEINNPMMAIGLNIDRIKLQLLKPEINRAKALDHVELIKRVIGRVTRIIEAMRNFSRDDEKASFETASAKTIVEETLTFCAEKFKKHEVELDVQLPKDEIWLDCRSVQVSQVLLNLLNNSFDAVEGSQEKKVWLELSRDELNRTVMIAVTDSGAGIKAENQEKVFLPFFTTKPVGRGTGLGLSLSRKIARDHGGDLSLDTGSARTRFVIELPVRQG